MSPIESVQRAIGGMQQIEREIIAQVRARQVKITASNFSWNHGRAFERFPPELIPMYVRVAGRHASTVWTRACLEDCEDRLDRPEVRQEIARIVEELAPQP